MPVKTFADNTNLLAYGLSTEPDPIGINPGVATLNIVVSNPVRDPAKNPITCDEIQIHYPVGTGASDLTDDANLINVTVSPTPWDVSKSPGLIVLRPGRDADGVFTTEGLLIKLAGIAVNDKVGTCLVGIRERSASGTDGTQWHQNAYQLAKFPYGWSFGDFAPKTSVVEHGQPAELDWKTYPDAKVPGVTVEIVYGGKAPIDVSAGPPFRTEPLTTDTAFMLVATLQIGGDTVRHYQTTTVSVTNPALTASSLSTSSLTVTGTSEFTHDMKFDGKVGIGTNPGYPLQLAVGKTLRIEGGTSSTDQGQYFSFGGNGAFGIDAPFVPGGRFIVDGNGQVGIGTPSPGGVLHLNRPVSDSAITGLQVDVASFRTIENAKASYFLRTRDLGRDYPEIFLVRGDGNVGVGMKDPQAKLHVLGDVKAQRYLNPAVSSGADQDYWHVLGQSPVHGQPADERLQEQISEIPDALDRIERLRGVHFSWNAEGLRHLSRDIEATTTLGSDATQEENEQLWQRLREQRHQELGGRGIGLLAQEVEQVAPELVSTDEEGYKSVDYMRLAAVLVQAIKEQQSVIRDLSARVAAIEQGA
jgi:hypothetical protein